MYIPGCPSPVAEVPQCSDPCPVDCEQCYPGTGWCTKCKPGFEGAACEISQCLVTFSNSIEQLWLHY